MAIICCAVSVAYAQTTIFVSSTAANDNGNGQSWETAKQTVAAGIAAAGENGTVYVKAGNYSVSLQLNIPTGVSVKGGYRLSLSGTDTTGRDLPGANNRWENASVCSIFTGGGSNRIAVVNGLLEGCVVRRGVTTEQGGGVLIDGGTVRYCVIRECDAIHESARTAEGGGVYIRNGGLLTNCVVTECRADNGPAVAGGNSSLINNTITRNWPSHCGKVSDYDGNVYNTVVVGQQCWTHENLRTTHYNDGTAIPLGNNQPTSDSLPYYYVNYAGLTSTNLVNYGYLYNWPAVMHGAPSSNDNPSGVTGICPIGWHVPSSAEWTEMRNFVNSITRYRCNGYDGQIGKALSSKSGWSSSSTNCHVGNNQVNNNATLFAAYPAGLYSGSSFSSFSSGFFFWTTRESGSENAWRRYLYYNGTGFGNSNVSKAEGYAVRCVKQLANSAPIVHTAEITVLDIQSTQVTCGGVCVDGGEPITAYGVCWNTSPNPTIDDSHTTDGAGMANFTSVITGLTNGVTYYVRAYAINSLGISYGEERVFTADDCGDPLNLTDYDGNQYNSVRIGTQCWMRENLRTTHYADGTAILNNTSGASSNYAYYYDYSSSNIPLESRGYLYNWQAATRGAASSNANPSGVQGICPNGWHLPSNAEWEQLKSYLSSQSQYVCGDDSTYLAKAMASKTGWSTSSNACAVGNIISDNNATFFEAWPAGYFYGQICVVCSHYCTSASSEAIFASSTINTGDYWCFYSLSYSGVSLYQSSFSKSYGYSVRCLRDE
jgi:uncharacterized protein (TIGR02145 family)